MLTWTQIESAAVAAGWKRAGCAVSGAGDHADG